MLDRSGSFDLSMIQKHWISLKLVIQATIIIPEYLRSSEEYSTFWNIPKTIMTAKLSGKNYYRSEILLKKFFMATITLRI